MRRHSHTNENIPLFIGGRKLVERKRRVLASVRSTAQSAAVLALGYVSPRRRVVLLSDEIRASVLIHEVRVN